MAHDRLLFRPLESVHPKYETPHVAIITTTALGIIFVSLRNFEQLAATVVTASLPFYILAVTSVFRLRRKAGYQPTFRTVGYPITPLLFIAVAFYLLAAAFINADARIPTAGVFGVILIGIPIYWIIIRERSQRTQ
jgi:amino acid transporter